MSDAPLSRPARFVTYVLSRAATDTGFAARMRRADNPDTDYQSWPCLAAFGLNLENDTQRLPYALIGAALCRLKGGDSSTVSDGDAGLGEALAACLGDNADQGSSRMLRVLACDSTPELCRVLRPLLSLLNGRGAKKLCHGRLLDELTRFHRPEARERAKLRWAQDFYSRITPGTGQTPDASGAAGEASGREGAA